MDRSQLCYTTRSVSSSQRSTAYATYEIYSKTSVPNLMSLTSKFDCIIYMPTVVS